MDLMRKVYWSFGTNYDSTEEFVKAVSEYNDRVSRDHGWDPQRVVANNKLRIVFEAMWKNDNDVIDLTIGDGSSPVTMSQVLWELNQSTLDFWGEHPAFFEGLSPSGGGTYQMSIGS